MRPGRVRSDRQAFRQILGRLENEVGTILQLIEEGKKEDFFRDTAPFWSLVRMLFPIAESVGDLIYRNDQSTVQNLRSVLENEFENERQGYRGKAAILTLVYRHALTHQDELRSLKIARRECRWRVSYDERSSHLQVLRRKPGRVGIQFDTTGFYDDLVAVCRTAMSKKWGGHVMKRYNKWLILDLRKVSKPRPNERDAISEIAAL